MKRRLRDLVWERAGRCCEYCRMPQDCEPIPFEIDHVIPQKHDGPTTADNLALACFTCNNHKGPNLAGRDPETNQIVALFNPRVDDWTTHFRWDGGLLLGTTPCGRTTAAVIEINLTASCRTSRIAYGRGGLSVVKTTKQPAGREGLSRFGAVGGAITEVDPVIRTTARLPLDGGPGSSRMA